MADGILDGTLEVDEDLAALLDTLFCRGLVRSVHVTFTLDNLLTVDAKLSSRKSKNEWSRRVL